jgi:mono/diheme cytochrome c family protein
MSLGPTPFTPCRAALAALVAAALVGGCSAGSDDPLVARGRQVYLSQCTQCHNVDPALPGPVGPAIKGASREVLEAKVLRGEYPPGHAPKRPTKIMPPQPALEPDIPALAASLK